MTRAFGFEIRALGAPVITDPPAHRYGIQRETDGRWYYRAENGTETGDFWKVFPYDTYPSAIEASEQANRLRAQGWRVRIVPLK